MGLNEIHQTWHFIDDISLKLFLFVNLHLNDSASIFLPFKLSIFKFDVDRIAIDSVTNFAHLKWFRASQFTAIFGSSLVR